MASGVIYVVKIAPKLIIIQFSSPLHFLYFAIIISWLLLRWRYFVGFLNCDLLLQSRTFSSSPQYKIVLFATTLNIYKLIPYIWLVFFIGHLEQAEVYRLIEKCNTPFHRRQLFKLILNPHSYRYLDKTLYKLLIFILNLLFSKIVFANSRKDILF